MSFQDINLKSSYETGQDNLLEEFYIPVLESAVNYDRIAGFFSSSSLAIAAKGIAGLIKNNGKMRIIACPKLSEEDTMILNKAIEDPTDFLENNFINNFNEVEDEFQKDHLNALGWMLAVNLLEIKIAFVFSEGKICSKFDGDNRIFHQKVGILSDREGNMISFSGSINETASGWLKNIEEFKVFKSWVDGQNNYLDADIKKFDDFWNNQRDNVKVYDLPKTITDKLIEFSHDYKIEKIVANNYKKNIELKSLIEKLSLFFYQKDAINKWLENGKNLLIQMATGTGKTRTAIGCIAETYTAEDKILIVVACPQGTLSLQWKKDLEYLKIGIEKAYVIDGSNSKWKTQIKEAILNLSIGYYRNSIIYTTHKTCSSTVFIESISATSGDIKILFIADEAHGLGAQVYRKGLIERYNYRIGLSATPSRWFDESGTTILERYFGNETFEFSIADALRTINPITNKTFLVNYYYDLEFVELTNTEIKGYQKLSTDISKLRLMKKDSEEYANRIERLLFKRANLIKNADNKYPVLREILINMKEIKDIIIFVSNEQIQYVVEMLSELSIPAHRLTENEGVMPENQYGGLTEREFIIKKFKEGYFKVLVAIKCLDEGIDIPSASTAILMASSTNPREYIQRIGRVIRQAPGKERATIYDISIKPCFDNIEDKEIAMFEKMVCDKEKNRIYEIAINAINNAEAISKADDVMGGY